MLCWRATQMTPGVQHYVAVSVAISVAVSVTVSVKTVPARTCRSVCRCWGVQRGSSAAGPGGRPASFRRKRVGGAPGVLATGATAKRKNRTRFYMNASTATADLQKRRTLFFYVSYGVLTEFLRMNVILTYFCNGQRRYGNGGTDT